MAFSVQLATGEILEPVPFIEGANDWNEAATLASQVIPASISMWWMTRLAVTVQGPQTDDLAILKRAGLPSPEVFTYVKGIILLALRLTQALSRHLEVLHGAGSDAANFNEDAKAFSLVTRVISAASPFFEMVGVQLDALTVPVPALTRSDMRELIDILNAYSSALEGVAEVLP